MSTRDDLAARYIEQLPYEPYPIQEEALLTWFTSEQGVLVCAPTGMGKTLIAEAALFEALHTDRVAYYTTPLIALTEQKFQEMQEAAVRWGFSADDVGLVTGNRRVNPQARVLVVVAEILFNRLLHREAFDFSQVSGVVMDEFHSFNDPERGIVWELSLGLLPEHVRLLLLSATVGNSLEFVNWLRQAHHRRLELVQGTERRVPLTFHWVPDMLLSEHLEQMAEGEEEGRKVPTLVFCFNREECWRVAEQLKGKKMLRPGQQEELVRELERHDWSQGVGPKLRQILLRGVGVHHAGVLPKYRRIVEDLFQRKLLSVGVCTETLSAGINLPARSVVLSNLLKGPPEKKRLIEPSSAHQIFGRAGRPQFDKEGFVYALAHEDDVKLLRWREKYDAIPDDTKDPGLRKAKKALKKKMPTRRSTEQYWTEAQFEKLRTAKPANLSSRGPLPWRLLAHMLQVSEDIELVRTLVSKRLMDSKRLDGEQKTLDRMLMTLYRAGYVTLEPEPPLADEDSSAAAEAVPTPAAVSPLIPAESSPAPRPTYRPRLAHATPKLDQLLLFRGVNPLYGVFLANQLGIADRNERIQAMESLLEMPGSVGYHLRIPRHEDLPPGPLATSRLDIQLLQLGLATPAQLTGQQEEDEDDPRDKFFAEERVFVLTLPEKLRMLFDHDFPGVHSLATNPVWAAGELLRYGGNFNSFITARRLQKQEGIVFRHLLRLILLIAEFQRITPQDADPAEWGADLQDMQDQLVASCSTVDPRSTDKTLEEVEHIGESNL